jgi:hypothetical protein
VHAYVHECVYVRARTHTHTHTRYTHATHMLHQRLLKTWLNPKEFDVKHCYNWGGSRFFGATNLEFFSFYVL